MSEDAGGLLGRLRGLLGGARPAAPAAPPSPAPDASDAGLIAASGLFEPTLYIVEGPDVREAGAEPLAHFCEHGWREGRRPNLYFDPLWYQERHGTGPDENPLVHYLRVGEAAGRRPVSYFDPAWYARAYPERGGLGPLAHFLAHRRSQRYAPNPDFDLAYYLGRYGSEIGPNRDPFAHLLRCGAERDLDPSQTFDSGAYRRRAMTEPASAQTPWAAADLRVPLVHYLDARTRS